MKYLMLVALLKKTDHDTKVKETGNKFNNHNHDKYIATQEFNKLAADFDDKLSNLNRKITSNKTRHVLVEN